MRPCFRKKKGGGVEGVAQQLRAFTALSEDPVPCIHVEQLTPACNSRSKGDLMSLVSIRTCTHTHRRAHTYIIKNNKNKPLKKKKRSASVAQWEGACLLRP